MRSDARIRPGRPWGPPGLVRRSVLVVLALAALRASPGAAQEPPTQEPPAEAPAPTTAKLPAGVVARIGGRDVTLDEYVAFLLNAVGFSMLDEYLDRLLVEEEARKQGVAVARERVEALVKERMERTVKSLYQGNHEKYAASLKELHRTVDEEASRLRQELYYEALWSDLVLKSRAVTEDDIRREFERLYGEGGVLPVARHMLFGLRVPAVAGKEERPQLRTRADARSAAEKALEEVHKGLDFVQAVKLYSEDALTRENDGRIPHYHRGMYGEAFDGALASLKEPRDVSGVVESRLGFHIIQLVERQVTKLEDVRGEIEKHLKERPPSRKELQDLLIRLRGAAQIERP